MDQYVAKNWFLGKNNSKKNQTNVQKKAKILVLTFSVSIQLQNNNLKWNFDLYLSQNNQ